MSFAISLLQGNLIKCFFFQKKIIIFTSTFPLYFIRIQNKINLKIHGINKYIKYFPRKKKFLEGSKLTYFYMSELKSEHK